MKAPRSGDEALAGLLGVEPAQGAQIRRRLPASEAFEEYDAALKAEASLADLAAVESLTDDDIEDAARAEVPQQELQAIIQARAERELRARLAAHVSWAQTEDPSARTRPAREAFEARFEREVDPDGRLAPAERTKRAEHARKAYFLRLALKSAQARRKR